MSAGTTGVRSVTEDGALHPFDHAPGSAGCGALGLRNVADAAEPPKAKTPEMRV
jgi:hypothetical protein